MPHLGEEGFEQFEVVTCVDGKEIGRQKIHDPFITNITVLQMSRWSALKQFFRPSPIRVVVHISGSRAAMSRIMMMDPVQLTEETAEWESRPSVPMSAARGEGA